MVKQGDRHRGDSWIGQAELSKAIEHLTVIQQEYELDALNNDMSDEGQELFNLLCQMTELACFYERADRESWLRLRRGGKLKVDFFTVAASVIARFQILEENETGKIAVQMGDGITCLQETWKLEKKKMRDRGQGTGILNSTLCERISDFIPKGKLSSDDDGDWYSLLESPFRVEAIAPVSRPDRVAESNPESELTELINWVRANRSGNPTDSRGARRGPEMYTHPGISIEQIKSGEFDPNILDEATKRTKERFKSGGADALAFYCPFHCSNESDWGIYIRRPALNDLAVSLLQDLQASGYRGDLEVAERIANRFLYAHEYFHHLIEVLASRLEQQEDRDVYAPYNENVYKADKSSGKGPEEEAGANRYAFEQVVYLCVDLEGHSDWSVVDTQTVKTFFEDLIRISPPGYDRALEFDSDAQRRLCAQIETAQCEPDSLPPIDSIWESLPNNSTSVAQVSPRYLDD